MSNVGAYRSVLSVFLESYRAGKPLNIVNDGKQKREFVHVDDVVDANLCAMNAKKSSSQKHQSRHRPAVHNLLLPLKI